MGQVVTAVTMCVGAGALLMSTQYRIGSLSKPGPGLWPAALAGALVALCLSILLVPGLADQGTEWSMSRRHWGRLAAAVAPLLGFVPAMVLMGSSLAIGLLAAYSLRVVHTTSLRYALAWAVVFAVAIQLIFVQGLNVPLPTGLLFGGESA
jgi:putative tricarboxylic transport membrane protein